MYGLSPLCLVPARCALEYFYNTAPSTAKPMPGSAAGRDIVSVLTLAGTAPAPPAPARKRDVIDLDGSLLRAGNTVSLRQTAHCTRWLLFSTSRQQ
jgi:hypothetical protein